MCGRLSLTAADHRAAAELLANAVPQFEVESLSRWLEQAEYHPHYNVGPGQIHWLVRARGERPLLDRGLWGMSKRDGPKKLVVNARAESIESRPMFRAAFAQRRCLIPADGFFEWERHEQERLPWWFRRHDRRALLFAAVFDPPAEHEEAPRFSIVTVPSTAEVGRIHDRMPAIVESEEVLAWLSGPPARARSLLRPSETPLDMVRVSKRFNTVAYDEPIEPLVE